MLFNSIAEGLHEWLNQRLSQDTLGDRLRCHVRGPRTYRSHDRITPTSQGLQFVLVVVRMTKKAYFECFGFHSTCPS